MSGNQKMRNWHLGSQNDGLFIIDMPPRPSGTDHPVHEHRDGISPDLAIPVYPLPKDKAQWIVDAHNVALASSQAEIERLKAALQPFVDILDLSEANAIKDGRNPAKVPDTLDVLAFRDVPGLKLGAFRAARAALSGSEP